MRVRMWSAKVRVRMGEREDFEYGKSSSFGLETAACHWATDMARHGVTKTH
jgi:hypothetical protein